MRLETNIKQGLISSLFPYYKNDIFNVFNSFFSNKKRLQRYQGEKINKITSIIKNPQIESEYKKFNSIINNVLYLSDLIFLFLHCEQFRKEEIIEKFYTNIPKKYNELISNKDELLKLRNTIAHFNFKDFQIHREKYLSALKIFEKYIGHNIPEIKDLPDLPYKPSLREILKTIYKLSPNLFFKEKNNKNSNKFNCNKDRLLLEICDEMALYNGYKIEELPSPWSILRETYRIKQKNKNEKTL